MKNLQKLIKLIFLAGLTCTIAACSSGGTESKTGLNLTGAFEGSGSSNGFSSGTDFTVNLQFSQKDTVASDIDDAEIDVIATVSFPGTCSFTLSVTGGELNRKSATLVISKGADFNLNAQVTNGTITGRIAAGDDESGCVAIGDFIANRTR